ncbi:cache domain-containing protein [bacterium]|nr:cache domain-containing protein [bacterium]
MKRKPGLITTYLYSMALIIVLFFILVSSLLISDEFKKFNQESSSTRSQAIEKQRALIKSEVTQVVNYINYHKSQATKRLRNQVKNRTEEAHLIADFIYQKNQAKPESEIAKLIHDALYAISWDQGRGYYFAEDLQGVELINHNNPELEGVNLYELKNSNLISLLNKILGIAKSVKGEGFCSYLWNQPDQPGVLVEKISYIKYFKPLKWAIGNGKYLHEEEATIKHEIITWYKETSETTWPHLTIGDWNGRSLLEPLGKRLTPQALSRSNPGTVNKLIVTARSGGGFINEKRPAHGQLPAITKLGYCLPIADWEWYVGAVIDLKKTEQVIALNLQTLKDELLKKIIHISLSLLFLLICSYLIARLLSNKIKKNIGLFETFFTNSATRATMINQQEISFIEFNRLADSANTMIEERIKTEHALKESENRFFQVVENAHIPMGIINKKGKTEFLNRKFSNTFGYNLSDVPTLEIWWQKAYPDNDYRKKAQNLWHKELRNITLGKPIESKVWFVTCKDSSTREVKFNFTPIGNRHLITFHDCTEENQIARERIHLEKELNQAQKMEAIGLLAGGVAHDLNNILSGIISYPEILLLQLPQESNLRKPLTTILKSGRRAAEIVNDLLTVARGVANKKEAHDIHQIIHEYLDSPEYNKTLEENPKLTLRTYFSADPSRILCSATHVKKCLMNLVNNSAEAINGNGNIEISTKVLEADSVTVNKLGLNPCKYICLSVKDDGPGISDDDIEHIFEPFYSKKVMGKSGSGLGLAVVWNTLQEHNGRVTATNLNPGTRFDLYFPATEKSSSAKNKTVSLATLKGKQEKILIVDDEPLQREVARQILEELNYQVASVASGEEAIAWFNKHNADLIILDMVMDPGINGRETYARIKKIKPKQKAFITSGFSENDEVEKTLNNGAGVFIKKPYLIAEFGVAVKQELEKL